MKNKYIITYFVFGTILTILGALFKITHMEIGVITGTALISSGTLIQIISAILFIVKLLSNKKNDFLNK